MIEVSKFFSTATAIAALSITLQSMPAFADDARVAAMIASLDARISELEAKGQRLEMEASEAKAREKAAVAKLAARQPDVKPTQTPSFKPPEQPQIKPEAVRSSRDAMAYLPARDVTVRSWDGPYVGLAVGGVLSRSNLMLDQLNNSSSTSIFFPPSQSTSVASARGSSNGGGAMLETFVGWNVQATDRVILGGQLEASIAQIDQNPQLIYQFSNSANPSTSFFSTRVSIETRWMASALFRAGWLIDPETMLYGVGGWTAARIGTDLGKNFVVDGWIVGAGVERRLRGGWSLRGEYRFTDFGKQTVSDNFGSANSSPGFFTASFGSTVAQFSQSMHSARIGVAYAFQ